MGRMGMEGSGVGLSGCGVVKLMWVRCGYRTVERVGVGYDVPTLYEAEGVVEMR